jgi:hypothetical protein
MRWISVILVLAGLCAGCMSAEERNANIAASDDATCQSYGAQPGSQAYFQCRMTRDQQRQANNIAIAQMWLNRPQPQPYVLPAPQQY